MKILGLIPARGGSKRIPRKNLAPLCGQPLIGWTIAQAFMAYGALDEIAVSTEDGEIATVAVEQAKPYGALWVIQRPDDLAGDAARTEDVVAHSLSFGQHDAVVVLQPTSPLRAVSDITVACAMLRRGKGSVYSVTAGGGAGALRPNGAIYAATAPFLGQHGNALYRATYSTTMVMPPERSIDVDTPDDLAAAERIMRATEFAA